MATPPSPLLHPGRALVSVGLGLAGFAAGYGAERLAMRRLRPPSDPGSTEDLTTVPGATTRSIPTDDGGECHVVEVGPEDAPTIVLLHGLCHSSIVWHYQMVDLCDRFRMVAIDHRGHGRSSLGSEGYGLPRLAKDVVTALETLDLEDVLLVGHSMGGMMMLRLCIDFPDEVEERVAGLVLASTSAGQLLEPLGVVLARLITPMATIGLRLAGRVPGGVIRTNDLSYLMIRVGGFGTDPDPPEVELVQALIATTTPEAMVESTASLIHLDVPETLEKIELPTIAVIGSRDKVTPVSLARKMVEKMPEAELVVLEGAGHMLQLERRHELNEILASFASELASSSRR